MQPMESTSPPTDPNFSSTRDFNDRERRRASRRIVLRVAISVGVGLLIFLGVCGWGVNRARRNAMQISCAANLRQIGLACLMYAKDDPQGRFPPRFEDALLKEDISAVVFCCPESNDTPAKGPTTQAAVDQLAAGGHLSYIYAGAGLTNRSDTNSIVAYEPLKNHHGEGMNVLFADGHIDWLTTEQAQKLSAFAQSAAGRPVRWDGKTATVGTAER
jgi:prepilin-type processing-associated H-X9-DG protein